MNRPLLEVALDHVYARAGIDDGQMCVGRIDSERTATNTTATPYPPTTASVRTKGCGLETRGASSMPVGLSTSRSRQYYRVCRSEQSCSNEQNRFITSISRIVLFEKPQSVCRYCSMVYQFSCKFIIASGGAENLPSQGANIVASAGLTGRV